MTAYCTRCGHPKTVACTDEQYARFRGGALIQTAMPDVPAEQRELLLSGICGDCWKEVFREEDEEED